MSMPSRGRRIAGWVLTVLLTALFTGSAVAKLLGPADLVEMLQKWGLGDQRILIGVGELTSALLFLIPRTHSLGVLLLSAYMGGAIVTHMQHGESYVIPSVILVLIWVTGFLRHSELLQSFWSTVVTHKGTGATSLPDLE
jgi:DoxX-like family